MFKRIFAALAFVAVGMVALLPSAPVNATTYTQCERLSLPVPGDPAVANIWGTILNTNFTLLDNAQGGVLSLSVAGSSNVVLTTANGAADQARYGRFVFTGTLTGNVTVLFPASGCGSYFIKNSTSGAFTLSIGANNGSSLPAGTTVSIPQGESAAVVSDGTNVSLATTPHGIGAARSGANSDITSLSALSTPLSTTQGGTGTSSSACCTALANIGGFAPFCGAAVTLSGGVVQTTIYNKGVFIVSPVSPGTFQMQFSNSQCVGHEVFVYGTDGTNIITGVSTTVIPGVNANTPVVMYDQAGVLRYPTLMTILVF